jgi:phosphate transport system permease protein
MTQPVLAAPIRNRANVVILRWLDRATYGSAIGGALCMLLLLLMFLFIVGHGAMPAIRQFGLHFLTATDWNANPAEGQPVFGARPLILGTLVTSGIAMVIAVPISVGCAVFLTKLAPKLRVVVPRLHPVNGRRCKRISLRHAVTVVSFMIELLAAIPSVAYGLWGFAVLVPFNKSFLQPFLSTTADLSKLWSVLPHWHVGLHMSHWPIVGPAFVNTGYATNMFTSGIILAIMVTPIITAIVRDVLSVAPVDLEHGALGLGATWWQATRLLLGFSKMGILGAVILGFARAIGETMAVTMVIGNNASEDVSIFSTGHSIASKLAVQFANADTEAELHALIYAAFILLVITMLINGIARVMIVRVAARGAGGGKR